MIVTVPFGAPGLTGPINVSVVAANEEAIAGSPPGGTLLIGGTAYVVTVLDENGDPITDFDSPLTLSFAIPGDADADATVVYFFDEDAGEWVQLAGGVEDGRFVTSTSHLTLFEATGGGLLGSLPLSGFAHVRAEGGTVAQFRNALSEGGLSIAFFAHEGRFITFVSGAPDFVNRPFLELFPLGLPAGVILIVKVAN